jgi:hypothetical protein
MTPHFAHIHALGVACAESARRSVERERCVRRIGARQPWLTRAKGYAGGERPWTDEDAGLFLVVQFRCVTKATIPTRSSGLAWTGST